MSYKITINKDGISFPQFYCDVCRKPITDLAEGNTIFSSTIPGNTSQVHKLCEQSSETKKAGYNNWHSLESDIYYLFRNYGWLDTSGTPTASMKKAIEKAAWRKAPFLL